MLLLTPLLVLAIRSPRALAVDDSPRWWKGNLHTHSLWSDGDDFPEMIATWYRDHGYRFLAFSDHNVLSQGIRWMDATNVAAKARGEPWKAAGQTPTDALGRYLRTFGTNWVETRSNPTNGEPQVRLKPFDEYRSRVEEAGRFLLIQAEELTHAADNGRALHLGAINVAEFIPKSQGATVPDLLANALRAVRDSATRTGREVLVHVNHPNYKWGVTAEDLAGMIDENFFEIWNGVDGDNDPGDARHPSTDELWDIANTLRLAGLGMPPLQALATDDSHDYQGNKTRAPPGRAWICVRSRFLTPESILRALRSGDFYASTGVELIDVGFDASSRTLSLQIQPQAGESYVTRFIGTRRGVNLKGRPRLDESGRVLETTLDYRSESGPSLGEVFAEVPGVIPSYTLKGDELYVRAVVVSSARPAVPSTEFEFQRAWTQPVGWRLAPRTP